MKSTLKHISYINAGSGVIEVLALSGWWSHNIIFMMPGENYVRWVCGNRPWQGTRSTFLNELPLQYRNIIPKYEWMFISPLSWIIVELPKESPLRTVRTIEMPLA